MKKVAEAAEELGVSRSTIYKYLKQMEEELSPYVEKEDGVTVIADEGIELIGAEVEKNKRQQAGQKPPESEGEKEKGAEEKVSVSGVEAPGLKEMQKRVDGLEEKVEDLQEQMEMREERLKEKMNDVVSLTNNLYEFAEDLDEKLTRMEDFERKSVLERLRDFVAGDEQK